MILSYLGGGLTTWDLIALGLFTVVTYFTFGLIKASLESGLTPGYTLDIFAINLFSQLLLSFTRYGWYVYALVPAYIGYKLAGYAWGYIASTNTRPAVEETVDPKAAKKQAKLERKETRKVKYVKA